MFTKENSAAHLLMLSQPPPELRKYPSHSQPLQARPACPSRPLRREPWHPVSPPPHTHYTIMPERQQKHTKLETRFCRVVPITLKVANNRSLHDSGWHRYVCHGQYTPPGGSTHPLPQTHIRLYLIKPTGFTSSIMDRGAYLKPNGKLDVAAHTCSPSPVG